MVTLGGKTFVEVIKPGEMIEDDLNTRRITSLSISHFTNRAFQMGSFGSGKKKEKNIMALMNRGTNSYNRQPPQAILLHNTLSTKHKQHIMLRDQCKIFKPMCLVPTSIESLLEFSLYWRNN